ncbi:hypothetical protein TNCV_2070881 [Trichonephila clavipes]|uniref:Uncharacterized protein n=1 Tax=Trichonephila clavipes TaxID=2585209 RepID=A0A8X7BDI5_TRICX|nr:hypothetical protein TNCV_2070881 [Trichonephila clavipes]
MCLVCTLLSPTKPQNMTTREPKPVETPGPLWSSRSNSLGRHHGRRSYRPSWFQKRLSDRSEIQEQDPCTLYQTFPLSMRTKFHFMNDNARLHRVQLVDEYFQLEDIYVELSVMSLKLSPSNTYGASLGAQ